jgi:hypothetical protein
MSPTARAVGGTSDAPSVIAKEAAMRILMASISLTAVLLLSGCVTLQKYPAFGNAAGGRVVEFDRQGARNILPPSDAEPVTVPSSRYSVIR